MIPEDYASEFRKYTSFVPEFGQDLKPAAVGPSDSYHARDIQWTQRFFTRLAQKSASWTNLLDRISGYSLHFYCGTVGNSSLDFSDADWYEHLWRADQMEKIITEHKDFKRRSNYKHKACFGYISFN